MREAAGDPMTARPWAPVNRVVARVYTVPTETAESDGTLEWDRTTLIVAHAEGGGLRGLGYTYGDASIATLIRGRTLRHIEFFQDHARLEKMLFDGVAAPVNGRLHPDRSRPGLGIELKESDAARFAA